MLDPRQAEVPLTATEIDGLCAILARAAGVVAAISGSGVAVTEGVDETLMEACAYLRGCQAATERAKWDALSKAQEPPAGPTEGADTPRTPVGAQTAG